MVSLVERKGKKTLYVVGWKKPGRAVGGIKLGSRCRAEEGDPELVLEKSRDGALSLL